VAVQTRYPHHPLFAALVAHNYPQFAQDELENRRQAAMPPFGFQATLRADHRHLAKAMGFVQAAQLEAEQLAAQNATHAQVFVADPLPLPVVRVANVERAQLLLEAGQRSVLQGFLNDWLPLLKNIEHGVRWFVEVDPLDL
jgi:primosomal protein N' (replication factor Y)